MLNEAERSNNDYEAMLVDAGTFTIPKAPAFIVIDGVNGAGKSTLQRKMAEYFASRSLACLSTREPGATELGKKLRSLVLEQSEPRMSELAELFLFAADRTEHVSKVITPSLAAGTSVISDRYYYSTSAFQGYGRGINRNIIEAINTMAITGVMPDLLILLDLPPEAGLARNRASAEKIAGGDKDSFEQEELAFHSRLRHGFLELARRVKEPAIVIDAARSPGEVWDAVKSILDRSFHG